MPTTKELETIIKTTLSSGDWRTSFFITNNKHKKHINQIIFTPLLATHFLSEAALLLVKKIAKEIFHLLKQTASQQKTWNYLSRNSESNYPDDLDSTAIAQNIEWLLYRLDQERLVASFVKQLVSQETHPGGPYRTWFFDQNDPAWGKDVDLIINYRVMKLLKQFGVDLPPLNTWLQQQSALKNSSPYYPLIESQLVWFQFQINPQMSDLSPANPYEVARLISMVLERSNQQQFLPALYPYYKQLIELKSSDLQPFPSFLDHVSEGKECWVGSRFLTASACLHALHRYETAVSQQTDAHQQELAKQQLITILESKLAALPMHLYQPSHRACQKLLGAGNSPALCFLPLPTAQTIGVPLDLWLSLATATIFGWAGYGLHDHVIDENKLNTLQVISSRALTLLSLTTFLELFNQSTFAHQTWFRAWLTQTYWQMEATYLFDARHSLTDKPTIGWDTHIFNRSAGLLVAPAMIQLTHNPKITDLKPLLAVGKPLIIAKQLLDDLHDWEDDWQKQTATPVTHALAISVKKSATKVSSKKLNTLIQVDIAPPMLTKISRLLKQVDQALRTADSTQLTACFASECQRLTHKVSTYHQEQKIIKELSTTFGAKPT